VHRLRGGGALAAVADRHGARGSRALVKGQGTFNELMHYSYAAADKTFTDAPNVTLYNAGTLIWGTQP
jgi:hypothetical protein